MKILLVAKNPNIIKALQKREDYTILDVLDHRAILNSTIRNLKNEGKEVDTLIYVDDIESRGDTINILINIKKENPLMHIVYITKSVDLTNMQTLNSFKALIDNGIFNFYHDSKLNPNMLYDLIDNRKSLQDVAYIDDYIKLLTEKKTETVIEENKDIMMANPELEKNSVIMFSSIKPGSGKSFVAINVAADIAKNGRVKRNYQPPRVLIIEADLQTLSVGTILGIDNPQYNLKTCFKQIARVVTPNGDIVGTEQEQKIVYDHIKNSCIQNDEIPNLFALVGNNLSLADLNEISPYYYYYLLEVVVEMFDIVIVDANSSLEHKTTGPLLQMAKQIYMVVNPDLNSVMINARYRNDLKKIGIADKVKYIVNKQLSLAEKEEIAKRDHVNIDLDLKQNFDIVSSIPAVDQLKIYNLMHKHKPLVLDDSFVTLSARFEFAKLSNQIWPMENFTALKNEIEAFKAKK